MNILKYNTLSVKTKWRLLLTTIVISFYLAYQLNISKTLTAIRSYTILANRFDINQTSSQLHNTPLKIVNVDDTHLLDSILRICEAKNIIVKEISQSYSEPVQEYKIETNKIILEGTYQNILESIYEIEQQKKIVSINAACWEMTRDKMSDSYSLLLTIYIKYMKHEKVK